MDEWCTHLENILECMAPYKECYKIEEMKKLYASILDYVVMELEKRHNDLGGLRDCPIYMELIGSFPGCIIISIFGVAVIGLIVVKVQSGEVHKTFKKSKISFNEF